MARKKILFIEDEKEIVALMKERLASSNYEMIAAYDGEEGLKKVYQNRPDLILLDILIPRIDGLKLCRRLKDDDATKHIPIIIVSASAGKNSKQKSQAAGADDLIVKPFEAKELLDKIARHLNK
ncbi:MAG: response regulator [Candidatus Omnitrophota bacterium]|nr:MAG: response regulator [Candidatus Omnitrophota bacterium]